MKYTCKKTAYIKTKTLRTLSLLFIVFLGLLSTRFEAFALDPRNLRESSPPIITDEGIIFTYQDKENPPGYVMVSGDFNKWEKPIFLQENRHGIFVYMYNEESDTNYYGVKFSERISHYISFDKKKSCLCCLQAVLQIFYSKKV